MALVESFSGIRGIYGRDLDEGSIIKYVFSFVGHIKKVSGKNNPTIVLGMDTRHSGKEISGLILGMLDCSFIDVGICPTPIVEFAVRHFAADGGIIITASHNEPEWNGLKFLGNDGAILREKEMAAVISESKHLKNMHKIKDRKIFSRRSEAINEYARFLFEIIGKKNIDKIRASKQKIIADPNGGAGIVYDGILTRVTGIVGVNMDHGKFSRKVEPTEDSMYFLKDDIMKHNADFAAGFDCDADRIQIMMKNGDFLSGNNILALVIDKMLSMTRKKTVVVNDATSNVVRDIVKKHKGKIIEVEVGETNIVTGMEKSNSIIGGEGSSGGVIISPSKCRDGLLTLLMILVIASEKKLEDAVRELPKYYTLNENVKFDMKKHDTIKSSLKKHYGKYKIKETGGIKGGLKVLLDENSFVWFRASKTEGNVFRIIIDSSDKKKAEELLREAKKSLDEAKNN